MLEIGEYHLYLSSIPKDEVATANQILDTFGKTRLGWVTFAQNTGKNAIHIKIKAPNKIYVSTLLHRTHDSKELTLEQVKTLALQYIVLKY